MHDRDNQSHSVLRNVFSTSRLQEFLGRGRTKVALTCFNSCQISLFPLSYMETIPFPFPAFLVILDGITLPS